MVDLWAIQKGKNRLNTRTEPIHTYRLGHRFYYLGSSRSKTTLAAHSLGVRTQLVKDFYHLARLGSAFLAPRMQEQIMNNDEAHRIGTDPYHEKLFTQHDAVSAYRQFNACLFNSR